ncbi:MAG: prolyl oligopeptidase family serine peptidase, partial [Planctomycetes bacterium]|nr:prolyl oligopeptidase family serine peptidase [Planctomycetota bacterium]
PAQAPRAGAQPWLWYAPTLPPYPDRNEQWLFEQLTAAGVAIAGIDVGESYGSAAGVQHFEALYEHLVARGWSTRPVLLGRSRGGLQQLNYAATFPGHIGAFVGIYPVCHLRSYPGLAKAAPAYGLDEAQLTAQLAAHNPLERLAPIAAARVPMFVIHGDQDRTVPLAQNSEVLVQRYRALGGAITFEPAPGHGHDVWPGFFRSPQLLAFVLQHAR